MGNRVSLILFLLASADLLHADPLYTIETFFTWSGGVLVDLGTLGGSSSSAYGINSSGQTAGSGMTADGTLPPSDRARRLTAPMELTTPARFWPSLRTMANDLLWIWLRRWLRRSRQVWLWCY